MFSSRAVLVGFGKAKARDETAARRKGSLCQCERGHEKYYHGPRHAPCSHHMRRMMHVQALCRIYISSLLSYRRLLNRLCTEF